MAISSETIDKIKQIPISDVLEGEGVPMKRVGREFVCQCVWHDDTNPSLTISDNKGFLFCHVCRASGDSISYVKEKYGLSFREAVERIASNHSVQVLYVDENSEELAARKKERDEAYQNAERLQEKFRRSLKDNNVAKDFIKSRKILPATSREFGLGYDSSKRRLTIPIHNSSGKLVGFTRRTIAADKPKYINTETNVIFNKSDIVFNEYRALESIREAGECVFVEGHIDVIMLHQYGIKNVVALQGTASPDANVIKRLLKRTNRFVLCMDQDQGGYQAIGKFLSAVQDYALSGKLDVRIATMPDGYDPDDCIKNDIDMHSTIANSSSWIDWMLDTWLDTLDFNDTVVVSKVENKIKDLLSKLSSQSLRTHYFDKAALRLAQNKQNVAVQIAKNFHESYKYYAPVKSWRPPEPEITRRLVEKRMVRLYIHNSELRPLLQPLMSHLHFPEMRWLWNRIVEAEEFSSKTSLPEVLGAMLMAAEPQYLQQLRPIIVPTITLDSSAMVVKHIEDVMLKPLPMEL